MAGQLQSTIVEIGNVYNLFLSLREINPKQSPACVVECLEKFFCNDNSNPPVFRSAETGNDPQIKILKNLQTAYKVYEKYTILHFKSAPDTLIETLDAILSPLNLNPEKVEKKNEPLISHAQASTSFEQQGDAADDESDSSFVILEVKSLHNGSNKNNKNDDDNNEEYQENDSPTNLAEGLLRNAEEIRDALPLTSSCQYQLQRVKNWVQTQPSPIPTGNSDQDQINSDAMEISPQDTASSENVREKADAIASNGDESSFIGLSSDSNQNEQQNDNGVQVAPENKKVYECTYNCGKTFRSFSGRHTHEKIHSGVGLIDCSFCDRQFTTRQNCAHHEKALHNYKQTPAAKKPARKRTPSSVKRRFRCEFCSNTFPVRETLETHQRNKAGEHLKRCRFPSCTRGFCYESLRLRHEKSHHRV